MSKKLFFIREGILYLDKNMERDEFPFLVKLPKKFSDVLNEYTELEPEAITDFVRKKYYKSFGGSSGADVHIAGCIYVSELLTKRHKEGNLAWEGKIGLAKNNYAMPDIILLNDATEIVEVQSYGKMPGKKCNVLKKLKHDIRDLKLSLAITDDKESVSRMNWKADKNFLKNNISTIYLHPPTLEDFCRKRKIEEVVKEVPYDYFI